MARIDTIAQNAEKLAIANKAGFKQVSKHLKKARQELDKKIEHNRVYNVKYVAQTEINVKSIADFVKIQLPVKLTLDTADFLHASISDLKALKNLAAIELQMMEKWDTTELPKKILHRMDKTRLKA